MAQYTVGFLAVSARTPRHIYSMRNSFNMFWIGARTIATKVVEFKAVRDRAYKVFVGPAMCFNKTAIEPEITIGIFILRA